VWEWYSINSSKVSKCFIQTGSAAVGRSMHVRRSPCVTACKAGLGSEVQRAPLVNIWVTQQYDWTSPGLPVKTELGPRRNSMHVPRPSYLAAGEPALGKDAWCACGAGERSGNAADISCTATSLHIDACLARTGVLSKMLLHF
jgi:hypothetical protein